MTAPVFTMTIETCVNGISMQCQVRTRQHLADFVRDELGLTGTHLGCEHGVCGSCSIVVDGAVVRGCLMLATQADGARIGALAQAADDQGDADGHEALRDCRVEASA